MKTATQRIGQLVIGITAILSLSVASVAACTCSHHESKPEPKASCHAPSPQENQTDDTASSIPQFDESCICLQPSVKRSVKGEGFKLKKHPVTSAAAVARTQTRLHSAIVAPNTRLDFGFWENQFSSATSSRGPPLS